MKIAKALKKFIMGETPAQGALLAMTLPAAALFFPPFGMYIYPTNEYRVYLGVFAGIYLCFTFGMIRFHCGIAPGRSWLPMRFLALALFAPLLLLLWHGSLELLRLAYRILSIRLALAGDFRWNSDLPWFSGSLLLIWLVWFPLPEALRSKSLRRSAMMATLTGTTGLFLLLTLVDVLLASRFRLALDAFRARYLGWEPGTVGAWLMVLADGSGLFWNLFILATLSLLAYSYILWARIFSKLAGGPLHIPVSGIWYALLGAMTAGFLFTLADSTLSGYRIETLTASLESRFGRGFTPEAMREYYLAGRPAPPGGEPLLRQWTETADRYLERPDQRMRWLKTLETSPARRLELSPGARQFLTPPDARLDAQLEELERLVRTGFPDRPPDFIEFSIYERSCGARKFQTPIQNLLINLIRGLRCDLQQALALGRPDVAMRCYRLLRQFPDALAREISFRDWKYGVDELTAAIEFLTEAGVPSDAELRGMIDRLRQLEDSLPEIRERQRYFGVGIALGVFRKFMDGTLWRDSGEEFSKLTPRPVPLDDCRFLLPQLAGALRREQLETLRRWSEPGFMRKNRYSEFTVTPEAVSTWNQGGAKNVTTRLRTVRVLLEWEFDRRENGGRPPETLPAETPPDPFTGEPLRIRIGESRFPVTRVRLRYGRPELPAAIISAPAVRVWSVGANQRDDAGYDDLKGTDDVAAALRLPPFPEPEAEDAETDEN